MHILVTGGAGFIGSHLVRALVREGHTVVSIDDLSAGDERLRQGRIATLPNTVAQLTLDIADNEGLEAVFQTHAFDAVYHLAAKAGVRASIANPDIYARTNYLGTLNVFELAKRHQVPHVIFASSSSVYGDSDTELFSEHTAAERPISIYAATKRAGELLAHTYCHLFGMNITCLRFFTVYGPYGRPDMAPFMFTKKIIEGDTIEVFNHGKQERDFTYISDIVAGCVGVLTVLRGYNILNVGNGTPVTLGTFISTIETILGVEAKKEYRDAQPGDVAHTHADIQKAHDLIGYRPQTDIVSGMRQFIAWYKEFYSTRT